MSAPHQKLSASNITCRYWATSGTCFFGDQCNFSHNLADRATSGRAVPRREKACKDLLLFGYCKKENEGCEYNHSIPGVTYSGPSTPTTAEVSSSAASPAWNNPSTVGIGVSSTPGTAAAAIRNKGLPVTAPAFIPAAVAAAQRASFSAWGGVTPGGGRALSSSNSPGVTVSSPSLTVTSTLSQNGSSVSAAESAGSSSTTPPLGFVGSILDSDSSGTSESFTGPTLLTSTLPANLSARPFVPGSSMHVSNSIHGSAPPIQTSSAPSSIGSVNVPPYVPSAVAFALGAAPFVPKAKQNLHTGGAMGVGRSLSDQSLIGMGAPPQQLQLQQQISQLHQLQQHQAAQMMAAAARGMGGNTMSSPYVTMDVPMVMQPFRLPDGDDPALGMTAMSPPNPAFALPMAHGSNGTMPALPTPEALAGVGTLGDVSGAPSQPGTGFPSSHLNQGSNIQTSSARTQQMQQQMQKLQIHHHPLPPLQLPGQTHPFCLRPMQKVDLKQGGVQIGAEKQQHINLHADMGHVSDVRKLSLSSSPNLFAGESQASDQLSSLQAEPLDSQHPIATETPAVQQRQPSPTPQQQHLQSAQQRQQQLQPQQMLHQKHMHLLQQRPHPSNQRAITSPVQPEQRIPFRSPSPVTNFATSTATLHRGPAYFLGPGQGIGSLPHVSLGGPFSGSARWVEGRLRGQSNVGIVPPGPQFMSEQLREELRRRHALIHAQLDSEQNLVNLPEAVQQFHTLYPLEDVNRESGASSVAFGVHSMIFKGISSSDRRAYAIRRIDSRQVPPNEDLAASAAEVVERWAPLARHPHIVAIREAFVSTEIEDSPALFFVHDYYPGAVTMEAMHLHQEQAGGMAPMMVSEDQLWSYMVQLTAVLRAVHSAGLFFQPGGLHPSKVILPTRGRLRVSSAGILDALNGDPADDPRIFQKEDLAGFGRLMLSLACGSMASPSLEFMAAHYSADFVNVTQALLASSLDQADGGANRLRQLYHFLAQRMFGEIEQSHLQNDDLMSELSKETENGRLLRLLVKLGMTNERSEDEMDPGWSESGDRYLLKLFRDFVFHQTTEDGTPLIDWTHVLDSLNKLDAGVPEKMILLSRDERSMLFASYGDLKRCLEAAYQDLVNKGAVDKGRSNIVGAPAALIHNSRLKQRQVT